MPGQHAILSASGADRWIKCSRSARLEETLPENVSDAADEGTLAHAIGELMLRQRLGLITKQKYTADLIKHKKHPLFGGDSMLNYCEDYAIFVLEQYGRAQAQGGAKVYLEQKLDTATWIPEGFCTSDSSVWAGRTLYVNDLKYGKGVEVSAVDNSQLKIYALGVLDMLMFVYGEDIIDTVILSIYQPRLDNFSSFELPVAELLEWAENTLRPAAALAFSGGGTFNPGNHCKFCRVKPTCAALSVYNLEIARHDFALPVHLTAEEIVEIYERHDLFTSWLKSIKEHALAKAIGGYKWPGLKLVTGRSNRAYSDEAAVVEALQKAGWGSVAIYESKLFGITKMEETVGKAKLSEVLGSLIIKPQGAPTLVSIIDKRPELQSAAAAKSDFAAYIDDEAV